MENSAIIWQQRFTHELAYLPSEAEIDARQPKLGSWLHLLFGVYANRLLFLVWVSRSCGGMRIMCDDSVHKTYSMEYLLLSLHLSISLSFK